MVAAAERIAAASGCIGTIGIDFVAGDEEVWAIEVNPRFQGTVDTVEMACGCNLFRFHADACAGKTPGSVPETGCCPQDPFSDRDMTVEC